MPDRLGSAFFKSFHRLNPDFDLLHHDLLDPRLVARLDWADFARDTLLPELRQLQRVMRVCTDQRLAARLIKRGYRSAHHIAASAEHQFVRENLDLFGGDAEQARIMHRRATHIKESIKHVHAWVRNTVASPFYRAMPSSHLDAQLVGGLTDIPSYQDLFGKLDYLECEPCESIFGPAAYFVDLMRLTDQGITDPNKATIPEGYKLEERRPDLFDDLDLTCANTLTVIPYLDIVNRILEKQIEKLSHKDDAYKVLATARYPIDLPFNQPLERIRTSLGKLNSSLSAIYRNLKNSSPDDSVTGIDIAREDLGFSVEDLKLLTTPDDSVPSVTGRYGYAASARLFEFAGDGRVEIDQGKREVRGTGTRFDVQVIVGDQVRVDTQTRTVTEITSPILLKVGFDWQTSLRDQVYTILPKEGLFRTAEFLARTGMTNETLADLVTEQLDSEELANGTADQLFINATGEGLPRLQVIFDESDPEQPMGRIVGLSLKRLDRLNRFIRLQRALGWAFADVDWAIRRGDENPGQEISDALIVNLSRIRALLEKTKEKFDELSGLWSDLKTIGRVSKKNPQDTFDRIFNRPALLGGKDPYGSGSSVPFNPGRTPVQQWTIAGKSAADRTIRSRLAAALSLSDDDLILLANFALSLKGVGSGVFDLDLPNLSSLYRLARIASLCSLKVQEYLTLLCLTYYPESPYLEPPVNKVPATIDAFDNALSLAAWLTDAALDIFQLKYALTEEGSPFFDPSYDEEDIPAFLDSLAAVGNAARLKPAALVFDDLTRKEAEKLFVRLVEEEVVTSLGLLLADAASFDLAILFPLQTSTFKSRDITEAQSNLVFVALVGKKLILPTPGDAGVLSSAFTKKTSLQFLDTIFTGPESAAQISSVRALLLEKRRLIEHTAEVLADSRVKQTDVLTEGLSSFLGAGKKLVAELLPLAAAESDLTDYLAAFLTPVPDDEDPPEGIDAFVAVEARFSSLAEALGLLPRDLSAILAGPHHFNIESVASLDLPETRVIWEFKAFENAMNIRGGALLDYFALPKDSNCPARKINKLAKITGWDAGQICELIEVFWPDDEPSVQDCDYDTVLGLERMKRCFDNGRTVGLDIEGLLNLTAISHLPVENSGGSINEPNWIVFTGLAGKLLDTVSARFGPAEFTKVDAEIHGQINSESRDHLIGHALWLINKPEIATPADLYKYFLIDVEMDACMDTSRIEQGIASVQLYMQRCRMMQEPGVEVVQIKKIWWTWISRYRVWEVNRKVFLYPENYLDPTLRSTATPLFRTLAQNLAQGPINKNTVGRPFDGYLKDLDVLAGLQHCGAYCAEIRDPDTDEKTDRLYLFAKTVTEPTTFYYRALDEIRGWGPFEKIDLNIASQIIAPVYAFDRLFFFWLEPDMGQSSSIKGQESETETLSRSTLKYSFVTPDGRWVQPQVVSSDIITRAFRNNYPSLDTATIQALLDPGDLAWKVPYGLSLSSGFAGKGRVSVVKGLKGVFGLQTRFDLEVEEGDQIWCNGEFRTVDLVDLPNNMVVRENWSVSATAAEYKVVPKRQRSRLEPFSGPGWVRTVTVSPTVFGEDTQFFSSFSPGDKIVVGSETRIVTLIATETQLLVDRNFGQPVTHSPYTVIPTKSAAERLVLFLGSALSTAYDEKFAKPDMDANPGLNLFLAQRNGFNQSMFTALNTASVARTDNSIEGVVTLGPVFVFDRNLLSTRTRAVLADYGFSGQKTPEPYRAVLDRNQELLAVMKSRNALTDNYWGDSLADTADAYLPLVAAPSLNILYYVSETRASLINVGNQPGWFLFNNSDEAFLVQSQEPNLNKLSEMVFLNPMPVPLQPNNLIASAGAHTPTPKPFDDLKFQFARLTTATVSMLMQRLFAGGIDNLLTIESQELPELPFSRFYPAPGTQPPPATIPPATDTLDFHGAFGLYFYELFFHAPFLIAWLLGSNQRFEEAKSWLEYIFNPMQEPDPAEARDKRRFWRFLPFRNLTQEALIKILTDKKQIARYNDSPFDPDVIADLRPIAYAKAVVMKYVDNLLEWGDLLFAQDTREAITQATNLYVLAADLLGPRPRSLGKKPSPKPINFEKIRKDYPAGIPQFVIDLENTAFSNWQGDLPMMEGVPINDISSYFCVPENADLVKYWDRVEDRLFKIRHCMNISGVVRSLALFEPPIDVRLLIRAMASGGGLPSLTGQLKPAIPFYKFDYLIDKAKEFNSDVIMFGSVLQAAYESKSAADAELLQARQEKRLLDLTTKTLEGEIQDAANSQVSIQTSVRNASFRKAYFQRLLREDISSTEQTAMDAMLASLILQTIAGIAETAAAINYTLPQIGSPFALTYGGEQLGNTFTAVGAALQFGANVSAAVADRASTMATYQRRRQDWQLEIDQAGFDEIQLASDLAAADVRRQIAEQQLVIHQETIRQNDEMQQFLRSRFSNADLQQWIINRVSTLYFQMYTLAYDLALAAQQAFQYEYNTTQTFLEFGYWDDRAAGLLAGEGLELSLQQMDKARLQRPARNLEIQRTFSLAEIDPLELLSLKSTGECVIRLTEKLFDYDFPGHYLRKIRTASITLDAEEGAFTGISGTLTQLSNYIVMKDDAEGVNAVDFLLGGKSAKAPSAEAMRSNWWNNQEIALSTGEDDSGMFELDLFSTSYLPFEGTGAVSTWRLSLPPGTNRFAFESINDVVLNLLYTAVNGGVKFRDDVLKLASLKPYTGAALLDLRTLYEEEWQEFMDDHSSKSSQALDFEIDEFVPAHIDRPRVTRVALGVSAATSVPGSYISLKVNENVTLEVTLTPENFWSYGFKDHGEQEPTAVSIVDSDHNITFDLAKTPPDLKDSEGEFLDAEKLFDIQIVFFYEGDVKV